MLYVRNEMQKQGKIQSDILYALYFGNCANDTILVEGIGRIFVAEDSIMRK